MLIGAMNNPAQDVIREIEWMADIGLDFVDLTLEPPQASAWNVDAREIKKALDANGMRVVGHTAYYLPLSCPFESIRRSAVEELKRCLEIFGSLGAAWMNLHPDRHAPMHERSFVIERNLQTFRDLMPTARACGVELMIENIPGSFNTLAQLSGLLDAMPELGLHLDIGHTNLMVEENSADEILAVYGQRLCHVHLHDNKGGSADLHLPLGTGNIDVRHHIKNLQRIGYDGTVTLEVFSPDRHYLAYSRDVLRRLWDECLIDSSPAILV